MSDSWPLGPEHYDGCNILLEAEKNALPILDKIEGCDIDCQAEKAVLKERAEFAKKVKKNFFPDLP